MTMISLNKIPDALGYLVLNDDGAIIASGGELENNEEVSNAVFNLITLSDKLADDGAYKKVAVVFKESSYVISLSNRKIYILKKRFIAPDFEVQDENLESRENNVVNL